jgi:hypothetical protein
MVFNPTDKAITTKLKIPMYYTGLASKAVVKEKDGVSKVSQLNRNYEIELTVTIPANGNNWFVIE